MATSEYGCIFITKAEKFVNKDLWRLLLDYETKSMRF